MMGSRDAIEEELPGFEPRLIPSAHLRVEDVPSAHADFRGKLEPFCLTFDGYDREKRSIDECWRIAEQVAQDPTAATLDELRMAAFIHQRDITHTCDQGWIPVDKVTPIRKIVQEVRNRFAIYND
jgi:hypothetical protein